MTVGSGSTSASATALMTSLNNDSGYGGSIAGDSAGDIDGSAAWRAGLLEDRPTPVHTPNAPANGILQVSGLDWMATTYIGDRPH